MNDTPAPDNKPRKKKSKGQRALSARQIEHRADKGEVVGGGFLVLRRDADTGRIIPGRFPFEHPSYMAALKERDRLKANDPDGRFVIFGEAV